MNHEPSSPSVKSVAHRQWSRRRQNFPSRAQRQTFDRPADRIGPIQHPHGLAVFRRRFEHVAQRRDERVDAAAQILQIDEHDVERVHHRVGRLAHFAVQAEDRNAVHRIVEVRRLDHVVLLVAAQAMLRTEGGGDLDVAARGQRVERMRQVFRHRSGMRQQGDAPALQAARAMRARREVDRCRISWLPRFRTIRAQSNRHDESPACRADAPTPNRICGRSFPRSPPTGRDASGRR